MLSNAAALIEVLAERGPLSPAAIADLIDVARPSVYRLAEGTAAIGMTETLPDSRITLTRRFLHLADSVQVSMPEWAGAQEILDRLARDTGQTAYLSVLRHREVVCVAWARGQGIDLLLLRPGRSLPLYAGAAGRSILANAPSPEVLLDEVVALHPYTSRTLIDRVQLAADVEKSLGDGFTLSDEDVTVGIGAVGMPVVVGPFRACISLGGLAADIRENYRRMLHPLARAAQDLVDGAQRVLAVPADMR